MTNATETPIYGTCAWDLKLNELIHQAAWTCRRTEEFEPFWRTVMIIHKFIKRTVPPDHIVDVNKMVPDADSAPASTEANEIMIDDCGPGIVGKNVVCMGGGKILAIIGLGELLEQVKEPEEAENAKTATDAIDHLESALKESTSPKCSEAINAAMAAMGKPPTPLVVAPSGVTFEIDIAVNEWMFAVREYALHSNPNNFAQCEQAQSAFNAALAKLTTLPEPSDPYCKWWDSYFKIHEGEILITPQFNGSISVAPDFLFHFFSALIAFAERAALLSAAESEGTDAD